MPPKPMFEKEKIVEAALEIARTSGLDSVTARAVGERLGCSSRPIFTFFDGMEALQREVVCRARQLYETGLRVADGYVPSFKMRGLQMIRFAAGEPQLFRMLFMREDRPMDLARFASARNADVQRDLRELQARYRISAEEAERVVLQLWIHVQGICSLIVTGVCRFTDAELMELIGEAFAGAMLFLRYGDRDAAAATPVPADSADADRMCGPVPSRQNENRKNEVKTMILETERLILRPWVEADAEDLYEYAKDPRVGPAAGWPPHTSVENSRDVIRNILAVPETYAICLKRDNRAIGSIGIHFQTDMTDDPGEAEIGYWIGVPFWGNGYVPEAVRRLMRHAFTELGLTRLWCGYYDGNEKSHRVQQKCGFVYHHTTQGLFVPAVNETRTGHVSAISAEEWRGNQENAR